MTNLTNREKAIEVAICTFFVIDGADSTQEIYDLLKLAYVNDCEQMIDCFLDMQKNDTYAWEPFEGNRVAFMWEQVNYVVDHILNLFGD